jgi:hypothetical protein
MSIAFIREEYDGATIDVDEPLMSTKPVVSLRVYPGFEGRPVIWLTPRQARTLAEILEAFAKKHEGSINAGEEKCSRTTAKEAQT